MERLNFRIDGMPGVEWYKHTTDILTGKPFIARHALIRLVRGPFDVGDVDPAHLQVNTWGAAHAAQCVRERAQLAQEGIDEIVSGRAEAVYFYKLADELVEMDAEMYPKLDEFLEIQNANAGVLSIWRGQIDRFGRQISR